MFIMLASRFGLLIKTLNHLKTKNKVNEKLTPIMFLHYSFHRLKLFVKNI